MALASGTRVGPYEIVAFIGAGGMGEVYKARDSRLGREVAIKVLPASFAADAERLRRFEQEARAVAALSHPNILAVHDIGQYEGAPYLVSELLEGESLRDVVGRGPLSHRKAIDYAVQIAQGLAAAHGKDIAHRDLKPDNIFITREGRVKILDFGLAKTVLKPVPHGRDAGMTMTAVAPATDIGTVMGTAGYMSPEQVRGTAVDCRTDIFSFGAVLYEMLTGERAFKRDTTADTMAAILNEEPPELQESGRQVPPALDRIVRHCLEKAPEQRFQSARDLAFDLESVTSLTASGGLSAAKVKERRRWMYAVAALALLAFAAAIGWKLSSSLRPAPKEKFHQLTFRRGTLDTARFTPDGQSVIYTAVWEASEPELYEVAANGMGGHTLGIRNARLLAISRRGELAITLAPRQMATLLMPGSLARMTDVSAAPRPEIESIQAADFSPDNSELAIVRVVPEKIQQCQLEYPIGKVLYSDGAIDNLRFSPDGRYLAFVTHGDSGDDRGKAVILRSSGEKVTESPIYESLQGLAWAPSGDEVWFTSPLGSGQLHALNLSGKTREVMEVPGRLRIRDISAKGQLLAEQGIARRGIIIARTNEKWQRDLSWLDFGYLRDLSNDGKTTLFEEEGMSTPDYQVFVRDVSGSPATPLGDGTGVAISRDNKWVMAMKLTEPTHEFWLYPVGPGEPRRLSPPNLAAYYSGEFLSDGKRVVYIANERGHGLRTWLQDLTGGAPRPLTPEGTFGFMVSQDDKWLVAGDFNGDLSLISIEDGHAEKLPGVHKGETVLGWSSDNLVYVASAVEGNRTLAHVDKLNPRTGTRSAWRDLEMPPIAGMTPEIPIITPDGSTYGFGYRLRLFDLYTVSGVR